MSDTITVVGNVATAPRRTVTQNGVSITNFRVASAQRRFDRARGEWTDGQTNWYSISAFRMLADNAHASLSKGDRVVVTGRLRLREWDANGQRGMTAEIDADALGADLLWGTTVFTRQTQSPETQGVNTVPTTESVAAGYADSGIGAAVDEDGWSIPGAETSGSAPVQPSSTEDEGDDPILPEGDAALADSYA